METPIEAPQGSPPLHSLILSATEGPTQVGDRWEGGFAFVAESCDEPESWIIPCNGADASPAFGVAATENRGSADSMLTWYPFQVRASWKCDAQTYNRIGREGFEQRARRIFVLGESKLIESELWRGDAAGYQRSIDDAGYTTPNLSLAQAGVANLSTGGITTPTIGLRALIQAAAESPGGQRAMIHATPQVAMAWVQTGGVIRGRNGTLETVVGGHTVVAGTGYQGWGPGNTDPADGLTHWAYVTSPVHLLRSQPEPLGGLPEEMDRARNDIEVHYQATACAYWDGCIHAGVPIDSTGITI